MENMQHIGNVNNVMNIDDGYGCSGARDVYALNRRDPSKSSLGEMQPTSFADYDERIPAVDSLDDILGRSEESDDASNSFQPAKNKCSTSRNIKESNDAHHSFRRVTKEKDDKTEDRRKINIARNEIGGTAIGLDDKRKPKPAQGKPKPALLSENRKRSPSPRKVTFNNNVEPIGGTSVSSPRSNSLRRALERIQSYKKSAEERLGSRKPPTPYKVKPKVPSRLSHSLKIDTSFKHREPPLAKLSPSKVSKVLRDSKISESVAEKSGRISSSKPPVLLTSEKHGERIYSCTTPENKKNALKSPMSSDLKGYRRNKTETMQEIRNRLFEDFRRFPIPQRTSPRTTAPKPFYLRTDERIAFRHLIHPPGASYEEEELKFHPFKALPIPNYEADPLFYGIRKDWVGKRHTIPKPFQLSSPKNTSGKLRMSVDDEGIGRYRFRALPVPDFSYRPLSLSSHEVNLTTPYPFDLQLDQRMASRISFNGTARTNMLAKMYVRACSIIHETDGHEHEVKVGKSRADAKMPPKEAAYHPEIYIEQTSPVNRHKSHTISNTHQRMKTQVSNEVNQPATKPSMLSTALQGNKVAAAPPSPNSKTPTPIAAISPRTRNLLKAQMMVRSAPSTPTEPRNSPKSKASFKAKKMPDFSRPFVPAKKPPSPIQSLPNTPPRISTDSPRRCSMPITERRVRSAPSTPTGSSPKSKPTFKAKKMPDFSKPFVPVKKPPSPLKLLPSTPPPRIASESPRSKSSVKEQPSPLRDIPKTPPRIAMTSPRRTNVLNASAKMSPKHSTTTGSSMKSTTRFKAKKMPDFSKPFVPVKKPPSPLRTTISPSQRTTSPRFKAKKMPDFSKPFVPVKKPPSPLLTPSQRTTSPKVTSSRISINSPKSISSVSSMTSSKSRLGLPKMNPKRMSPLTAQLSQDVQTLNPPSPTDAFLSSNSQIKCSESGINASRSYTNDRKSTDSVTNRSRNKDLKSTCSMTLNESFCARPMPNFSKPFVPVKTTDMERALVQAVSKDKHLLEVLDNKLTDYKNRLIAQEFGDIGDDLGGREKIRQLADTIVKEVIDDVGILRSSFSINSSNHRRTVNRSHNLNSDLHGQRHDSKMTKNELQQDLVKGVKTSDSGLSDSSNASSVDPYLSYSATISPAGSTIEGDLSSKCSAVGTKGQDTVEFSSMNSAIPSVHLSRRVENQRYDLSHKSPSCKLLLQSQENADNVDSSKDHAIACPSSFSKAPYDDDNVGDSPSNGSGSFEERKKDVHNDDEDMFEICSRPYETELEVDRQESGQVISSNGKSNRKENISERNSAGIDIHMVNRAIAETNLIHASKPDNTRPISHKQHVTGLVSHNFTEDEGASSTPREHHVNSDSKSDESSSYQRNSRDGSCSLAVAFDESSVAHKIARGSSSNSFQGPVHDNNNYNGLSSFGTSTNSLQGSINENSSCAASDESSTCLPRDDAHVKTATPSQVLPLMYRMESDQRDSTRYEEGVLPIDAVEDCENMSRVIINDSSTTSDNCTVTHEYDPSEENSAIVAVDESPVSLETEVGSIDSMNGRIYDVSRYNGRSGTDRTSKGKTGSPVTIESLVAHETVGGSSNLGGVNEGSSNNVSSSSALFKKEVTFDESSVAHKTAGTSTNSLQGSINENSSCAASDESSTCLPRDDAHVKTATPSQVLPLMHCMESDQRDSTRYEEGVLPIDAVEDCENMSRVVINDSSIASDNRPVTHENDPSEENTSRLSKDDNDLRGRVNDNSSFDETSHHSPPNTDAVPRSRVVGSEKDISSTALFSATSSDLDDDPSHRQFSSHTESSLTKVLHSLHNTIERISLIERKFEQNSESSSISKAKMGSPTKSSATFQVKKSPSDDFGSDTIAFRAGWKRALALTDLIECQDENLSPETCRSLKVVESRFLLSKVNNDFEEARDESALNSRGKGNSEIKTPNKSRELRSTQKQHFSLYDSVLRCCSGKGELE